MVTWWADRHHVMKWQCSWRRLCRHSISNVVADGERECDEDVVAHEFAATVDIAQKEREGDIDTARQEPAPQQETLSGEAAPDSPYSLL